MDISLTYEENKLNNLTHICRTNIRYYELACVGLNSADRLSNSDWNSVVLYWYTVLFVENTNSSFFKQRINCTLLMKLEKNATDIFIMSCKFVGKQVITSYDRSVCLGTAGEWQGGSVFWVAIWKIARQNMNTETIKNLSSRQQMRNICLEFIASLVTRLAVFSLIQKQSLQLSRTKSPRSLKKKKIQNQRSKQSYFF
jgi:hypothetical protein